MILSYQGFGKVGNRIPDVNTNRKKMVIIGNCPIEQDLSKLIEDCDLVVRINEGKNYARNTGRKTDILCICNTGEPAKRIIHNASILNAPFYKEVLEVWFPRDSEVHRRYAESAIRNQQVIGYKDLSAPLVERNNLSEKKVVLFSGEFNERVFQLLKKSGKPFVFPSTGFFAIEYILNQSRFDSYEKIVCGFSFQGWDGHPWKTERRMILGYARKRDDFHFIPVLKAQKPWHQHRDIKRILAYFERIIGSRG